MDLGVSGLASGFDWRSLVAQLIQVERAPEQTIRTEQSTLLQRNNAYGSIKTELSVLSSRVATLNDPALYNSRLAAVGDATVASARADAGAAQGNYTFSFSHLATAAVQQGATQVSHALNDSNDVSGLVLSSANFSRAVTAGTVTVNGKQVSIETSDTLQAVFDKISIATTGEVTGSYDAATDKITLSSASPIILGSATDTSNFLGAAKLNNNGTGSVSSALHLGGVRWDGSLDSGGLTTQVSDGGAEAGEFKINGVSIGFSAAESMSTVLSRINDSAAGVSASYDALNDRLLLANKTTGDVGMALEDVTGNFLAATGLSGGTLQRGQDLVYSINGGDTRTSRSNTIDETSSGLTGLSVTALQEQTTTITVSNDTSKVKTALTDFVAEYNKCQSLIDTQTASSTDATGKVTAGILASEGDADAIASQLRRATVGETAGSTLSLKRLADLGFVTNGNDNSLTLADETALDAALSSNLGGVKALFTDPTNGLAVKLTSYLNATSGDDGSLAKKQANMLLESAAFDTQVNDMERQIASSQESLTNGFLAMEQAQSTANQQLQFLQQGLKSV